VSELLAVNVPSAPVLSIESVVEDEHPTEREMIHYLEH
jgi:crotonobetainyl-CoA:carnitine CoA-transferase CaiB-like acyl-CoA transferase